MKFSKPTLRFLLLVTPMGLGTFWFGACASGVRPHAMSSAKHQAMATQEDSMATKHAGQYDSKAAKSELRCYSGGRAGVCWYETINPTAEHKQNADKHREVAAQHRAASQALLNAEANACKDLSDEDRDMSPFVHNRDIRSVTLLREERIIPTGKIRMTVDAGATIIFRAVPGLTAEWLKRIVDCHLVRNAAVGHDMPEMADCPLVPRGAQAMVRSVGDGFAVDIRADAPEAAAEIWRRAQLIQISP